MVFEIPVCLLKMKNNGIFCFEQKTEVKRQLSKTSRCVDYFVFKFFIIHSPIKNQVSINQ